MDGKHGILVIGSDPAGTSVLVSAFSHDYAVTYTNDTEQAVSINRQSAHDVVIFEAADRGRAAGDFVSEIKSADPLGRPVIVLTTRNGHETRRPAGDAGVFYHLVKPCDVRDLTAMVRTAVRCSRAHGESCDVISHANA